MILNRDGNHLSSWGNGVFLYAHSMFIQDDIVYLTDRDSSVCLIYTLDGKPIQILGRHGADHANRPQLSTDAFRFGQIAW